MDGSEECGSWAASVVSLCPPTHVPDTDREQPVSVVSCDPQFLECSHLSWTHRPHGIWVPGTSAVSGMRLSQAEVHCVGQEGSDGASASAQASEGLVLALKPPGAPHIPEEDAVSSTSSISI